MISTLVLMFFNAPAPSLEFFDSTPQTEIMVVGTAHFDGDDAIGILEDRRQAELTKVIDQLAAFEPTIVGLECTGQDAEDRLNQQYRNWRRGDHELSANERQQIGFRLADRLGHDGVHCVDAEFPPAPSFDAYEDWDALFAAARENGEWARIDSWIPVLDAYANEARAFKAAATLPQIFDWLNTSDTEYSQARMLLIEVGIGVGRDWAGADWLARFEGRNIRIFSLVRDLAEPEDRILLIFGNAHKAPLDHLFERSPEFRVINVPVFSRND